MKYQIRILATAENAEAVWNVDHFVLPNGTKLTRDEAVVLNAYSVEVQIYEWYGAGEDMDPNDAEVGGRYKPKGGETIVVYLTDAEAMYGDFEDKLQAQFMKEGRYMKYSLLGKLEPYYPPTVMHYSAKADAFYEGNRLA